MKIKISLVLLCLATLVKAQTSVYQNNLSKRVTFSARQERVGDVLQKISNAGNFYFAYNGSLINQDSLVNLNAKSQPVREVLDAMFDGKVDYKENDSYIILRYAVNHFTIEPENITTAENLYMISGYVVDTKTGKKVKQASVYEKKLLQSAITDNDGFFTLKFKGEHQSIVLTASKETYRDTALVFLSSINVKPEGYNDPDKEKGTFFGNALEELGIGRFFLSSKQRLQNLNIPSFFANTPFQASLTPGLSSHGMMSSQVVNKFSLNVLGGYTAGVDGVEIGGIFNLNKGDMRMVQVAGVFNVVGRNVEGVQVAGLHNSVQGNIKAVQVSGLLNQVKKNVEGVQIAGLVNIVSQNLRGVQVAGLGNIASREVNGVQVAGLSNIGSRTVHGVQISSLFNYAKNNKGFQLALINASDTSSGTSLGLINLVKTGYHKLSFSTNETINANVAYKSGNANLYTMLIGGYNFSDTAKVISFGLGMGHDFILGKTFSFATELSAQHLYLGNWDYANTLYKGQLNLQFKLFKGLSIFGGPSYNYYVSNAPMGSSGKNYRQQIVPSRHQDVGRYKGWVGWSAGITIM
ncbi:STN and carboxypeptidase regulatory-like domain-containing protein [Pedobacter sp. KR3-3]|uniref:STN and carboxypeptidase regulatory-like domain-containing protein n=1 Tax=Pedobacter albus TaxID=3113905 RepID=A0ABU7ICL7_9SPHI|nr:STN and carboxypeptidase regulatory-like domain-containing protein [Pedobacter sp. KR3-3]MEE1947021.1 STN and carboxypeptidase regulatory-like domain-containing protein [Pedobacter sp. KR3-3]